MHPWIEIFIFFKKNQHEHVSCIFYPNLQKSMISLSLTSASRILPPLSLPPSSSASASSASNPEPNSNRRQHPLTVTLKSDGGGATKPSPARGAKRKAKSGGGQESPSPKSPGAKKKKRTPRIDLVSTLFLHDFLSIFFTPPISP